MIKIIDLINITEFPFPLILDDRKYYIINEQDQSYKLISSICPHFGAEVECMDDHFKCPVHYWTFDFMGNPLNTKGEGLAKFPLKLFEGALYLNQSNISLNEKQLTTKKHLGDIKIDFKLHAHACVEIIHDGFSILQDPWIIGTAFFESWINYPESKIHPKDLNPSVIYISHEHSDHLSVETLSFFKKNTPIYFPDFPNKRINKILFENGFTNLFPMKFGQEYSINEKIRFICFEPKSLWNDSILYIQIENFKILNLNDAGINYKISQFTGEIDLIMVGFSTTASGYPATWNNYTKEQMKEYYQNAVRGTYKMLENICYQYKTKYLLPFASFSTLVNPLHSEFIELTESTNPDEIKNVLRNCNFETINLLPGESWDTRSRKIKFIYTINERIKIYKKSSKHLFVKGKFEKINKSTIYKKNISEIEIKLIQNYFENLNNVPEIIFCENLMFDIIITDEFKGKEISRINFKIFENKITINNLNDTLVDKIEMQIPLYLLLNIINNNISWDEAHIGYWCIFYRTPDVFHQNFWRLLQAPYYKKKNITNITIKKNTLISQIIDQNPYNEKILARYGLYCYICGNSYKEDLLSGCLKHGLDENKIEKLIKELNF
jgi:CMP-N-acetylneuraminate monooxygenase